MFCFVWITLSDSNVEIMMGKDSGDKNLVA